jgi:hypothetical protein
MVLVAMVMHVRHEKNKDGSVSSKMHIPDGLTVH